ncbi:fimbrillin family protein [Parabacteroides bouchesdurhonensis]|uniref:fimbrillin family protein n=1 Tax=Parabacteroides bouchesdurhonensis TaxID=1936995 RepID=UPI000C861F19|nr:fimbrillin family protein [Parabacteroides bouchesdurhonensis]
MKTVFTHITLCAFLLFASCVKEGDGADPDQDLATPVAMQGRVADVELETRAGATTSNMNGKHFAVYAVNHTDGETAYGTLPAGTRGEYEIQADGSAKGVEGKELWLVHQRARIYAAHPAGTFEPSKNMNNNDTVPRLVIPTGTIVYQNTATADANRKQLDFAAADSDYMYGVAYSNGAFGTDHPLADNGKLRPGEDRVNEWGPSVSFGFRHAFARICIVLKRGQDYNGSTSVTQVTYTRDMPGIDRNTRMNLHTGALEGLTTAASKAYTYDLSAMTDNKITTATDDKVVIESYALPCEQKASKFSVTVDGKEMEVAHSADVAWEAGKVYVYTLSIKGTGLEMTGITMESWTAGSSTGSVEI